MIERMLAATAAGPLLGGLSWRPPSGGKHSLRRLHEARNLTTDATHYTLLDTGRAVVYGLFQPRPSEESVRLGKGVHAAAHCFAARVGAQAPNGALLLSVPPDGHRREEKVYIVVLEDGVPVVDSLTSEMEARNALGSDDRPIWSDNAGVYPNSHPADLAWLAEGAGKATRVLTIPPNPWPWVAAATVFAVATGGWWWIREVQRQEARREEARQLAASDPTPRYLAELARQRPGMLADRRAWVQAAAGLFDRSVIVPGWVMKSVACDGLAARCETVWQRRGGTFDDLRAALPDERLVLGAPGSGPVPSLDQALTSRPLQIARLPWPGNAVKPPTFTDAVAVAGPLFQVWKTAHLGVDIQPPRLWPASAAVPAGFSHPQAVLSGVLTVSDVPGPFVVETLETAPPWVSWENVRVDIGEGGAGTRLKFKATGVYYVSLH